MPQCLFCKIVRGESPSFKVFEDANCLAFLNSNPIRDGHILLIPKRHCEYIFDLNSEEYSYLFKIARQLSSKIQVSLNVKRVGILVSGISIPHVHIHLLPVFKKGDIDIRLAHQATETELTEIQKKILLKA